MPERCDPPLLDLNVFVSDDRGVVTALLVMRRLSRWRNRRWFATGYPVRYGPLLREIRPVTRMQRRILTAVQHDGRHRPRALGHRLMNVLAQGDRIRRTAAHDRKSCRDIRRCAEGDPGMHRTRREQVWIRRRENRGHGRTG